MCRFILSAFVTLNIGWSVNAKGQSNYIELGLPLPEAFAFSVELSEQALALVYDAEQVITDRDDRRDVLNQLREVLVKLNDLNLTLENAARNADSWGHLSSRAMALNHEILELSDEVDQAVEQMNRIRRSQRAYTPTGPSHVRSVRRSPGRSSLGRQTSFNMYFERVGGRLALVKRDARPSEATTTGLPPADVFPPIPRGTVLSSRVNYMQALSGQIQRFAY